MISHNRVQIKILSKFRYLGIIFDNNLRWNLHVNNLVGKFRSISYKFVKLRNILPIETIQNIYFAFFNPFCNMDF